MPPPFTRDRTLDIALESESRVILILIAIAVGILFVGTAIIIHGSKLVQVMRCSFRLPGRISNVAEVEKSGPAKTPTEKAAAENDPGSPMPHSSSSPQVRHEPKGVKPLRIPALFFPIRKYPSTPHRPAGVYSAAKRLPFGPAPPPAALGSRPLQQQTSPKGVVTPHVAEWMKVADSVVGRHPNAQPLCTRVATQAEVDLISGHVHIPWAYKDKGRSKAQPMPVKVLRSIAAPPPAPVGPRVLKDVGSRDVLEEVNNTVKRAPKGKNVPRTQGKENMPPTPLPLAHSARRN